MCTVGPIYQDQILLVKIGKYGRFLCVPLVLFTMVCTVGPIYQDQILLLIVKIGNYIPGRFLCVPLVLFTMVPRSTRYVIQKSCMYTSTHKTGGTLRNPDNLGFFSSRTASAVENWPVGLLDRTAVEFLFLAIIGGE